MRDTLDVLLPHRRSAPNASARLVCLPLRGAALRRSANGEMHSVRALTFALWSSPGADGVSRRRRSTRWDRLRSDCSRPSRRCSIGPSTSSATAWARASPSSLPAVSLALCRRRVCVASPVPSATAPDIRSPNSGISRGDRLSRGDVARCAARPRAETALPTRAPRRLPAVGFVSSAAGCEGRLPPHGARREGRSARRPRGGAALEISREWAFLFRGARRGGHFFLATRRDAVLAAVAGALNEAHGSPLVVR